MNRMIEIVADKGVLKFIYGEPPRCRHCNLPMSASTYSAQFNEIAGDQGKIHHVCGRSND